MRGQWIGSFWIARVVLGCTMILVICGCNSSPVVPTTSLADSKKIPLRHANSFSIEAQANGETIVTNLRPWRDSKETFTYRFVPKTSGQKQSADIVLTPAERIVVMSTTFIAYLDLVESTANIVGVARSQDVSNPKLRERIKAGDVKSVSDAGKIDVEKIVALKPDVVVTFAIIPSDLDAYRPLKNLGIPVLVVSDYNELTPLGRSEWVKFFGVLTGREKLADEKFEEINSRYEKLRDLSAKAKKRPSVLVGSSFKGVWYVPGGKSYTATLIRDAGGDYLWQNDDSVGVRNLDLEAVFAKGKHADFWINPSLWRSLDDGRKEDERYRLFDAFREGRLFNNNRLVTEQGGIDFWETGLVRMDLVLADLVKVFHPELLPDHQFVWYHALKEK